jgi:phosphate transport system permease protein
MSARSAAAAGTAGAAVRSQFATGRQSRVLDVLFKGSLLACLLIALAVLVTLLVQVFVDGVGSLSLDFLTANPSRIDPASSGIGPALAGTLWLMAVCILFIVPVGVASAIYLEEYANRERWFNRFIELNIQNLAAVPSIVYGVLGLAFLVRGPLSIGHVLVAGGLTLGLLVLPVLIVAAREAIRAVPSSIREGSLALGATKWQTIWKQTLPAALPGIATGAILSLSRAIGETAPLIVIGAALFATSSPSSPFDDVTALPIQIFGWISEPQAEYKSLAAAGIIVLMAILLAMNAVAIWLRNKYEKKW